MRGSLVETALKKMWHLSFAHSALSFARFPDIFCFKKFFLLSLCATNILFILALPYLFHLQISALGVDISRESSFPKDRLEGGGWRIATISFLIHNAENWKEKIAR